jgi:hypothetical protein
MKADTLTLTNLFNRPVTYVVPLFQRPYVWNKGEHWQPLWEDFRAVAERLLAARAEATEEELERGVPEQTTPSHFLGAVVLEQIPTGAGMIERRNIIDGQQRLLTLQLFLDAAHDVAAEYEDGGARLFGKLTDNDPDLMQAQMDRFKVWPTNVDRIAFQRTLGEDTVQDDDVDVSETSMWLAHDYFCEALRDWLEGDVGTSVPSRLDALRVVVWSLVRLVVIDLDANDNAQVIFETLNARGTPLLASDLIKNSLFQQATLQHLRVEDLYESLWKPLDNDWWRVKVPQGRLFRPRLDVFFFHWLTMRRGSDFSVHELFTQYKNYAGEMGDPEGTLKDIVHYAKTYRSFESYALNTSEEIFFYRLRITETATTTPLLLLTMGQPDDVVPPEQKALLMSALESWLIRRMLCRLTTKNYNVVFLNLLSEVLKEPEAAGDIAVAYLTRLQGESQVWPSDAMLEEALLTLPLYRIVGRGRLRMVLEALEDAMRPHGIAEESHGPRGLTIEHVLPQSWKEYWPLPDGVNAVEAASMRDTLKHSIGNLTLVTNKLNPMMSNAAWTEKREALREHTVLYLNKGLVNGYPQGWDEDTIRERSKLLAALAMQVWSAPSAFDVEGQVMESIATRVAEAANETSGSVPAGDVEPPAGNNNAFSHDAVRARSQTDFVRGAVDGIEDWLETAGIRVHHNRRSSHSMYVGKRWIGSYYFARRWIHFWLVRRDDSDSAFEALSQAASLLQKNNGVAGNVADEADLELFKSGVRARLQV